MLRALDDPEFLKAHYRTHAAELSEAALRYEGLEQVGVEMWFKAERTALTQRDRDAMRWWLERKVGRSVRRPDYMLVRTVSLNDPLSCRTYFGARTAQWGYVQGGQLRVGGGVKGWV